MNYLPELIGWGKNGWGPILLQGLVITLQISAGAYITGLVVGGLLAWTKLCGPHWMRRVAHAYTTVCRAVPDLLLILILFFAGQSALNSLMQTFGFGNVDFSGFVTAIIVLGLVQGAYSSEILRSAVVAIPRGQVEAAQAFGMEGLTVFRRVIVPGVMPIALAGLSNLWMNILKDSALVSLVGTPELLFAAKQAAGATKNYFVFYFVAAALFYMVSLASSILLGVVERRISRWRPSAT